MDLWFEYSLEESKYQLSIYLQILENEKTHKDFIKEMIRRLRSDIKKLQKGA